MSKSVLEWREKEIWVEGRAFRIAHVDGEKYTLADDPEDVVKRLKASNERIDLFTFLQHPPDTQPKYGYHMELDNLAVMPVTTYDHWWNHQIKSVGRNRARQAEKKGATIREVPFGDELLQGIVDIHNESPIRQGRRFPHYGMNLEGARAYAGTFPDRSIFIGTFVEEKLVGFIKLTMNEARSHACAVNILSMLKHRDKAPNNAMVAQAVKSCAERGVSYLVYENFSYGKREGDSLSQFKEVNGFRRMDLPRFFIPLTPLGRVALQCGLHRRLVDYCPEPLMTKYRDLRTWWLTSRSRGLTESTIKD